MRTWYYQPRYSPGVHIQECDQCNRPFEVSGWGKRCRECKQENYQKNKRMRGTIPDTVRRAVYERDGMVCRYCQKVVRPRGSARDIQSDTCEIDHVIAVADGGKNTLENLTVCCHSCNRKKQGKAFKERQGALCAT